MTLPTVAGNWDRMQGYREKFNEEVALWIQGFPPVLRQYITNRRELIDVLADAMPPLVAYNLFREGKIKARSAVDLFAGIGGWSIGLALYSYPEPLYIEAVDIDVKKVKIMEYQLNYLRKTFYPELEFNIIVKDVRNYEMPKEVDVIMASPPCEDVTPLNAFRDFVEYKGTVDLTKVFIDKVKDVNAKIFYENVYDKRLVQVLTSAGFTVRREDFSRYIPQKRVRLIATKNVARQARLFETGAAGDS